MRRPERELPVCAPGFAVCVFPEGLERRESELAPLEWSVLERLADDPPCEEGAGFEAAEGARAALPPWPGVDVAGAGESCGAAEGAGARAADWEDTATGMEDKVSTESVAMGDRPA
ncbi:MAG: hypothetical protein ACRETR_06785, partial [Steroidobacteraceae bacterium]